MNLLRSEWTKLYSLRSTTYTLLVTVLLAVGLGALISRGAAMRYPDLTADQRAAFDPTAVSLQSFLLAQLAVAVLGVLVVTSEHATGVIRTSLAAVPRRGRLLAAKSAVFVMLALVVGTAAGFGSFLAGQAVLAAYGAPHVGLGAPHAPRAVLGYGLYLAAVGLLGVAVGTLVRATAGAVFAMVTVVLLVPVFAPVLPETLARWVTRYWPPTAGGQVLTTRPPDSAHLAAWSGYGVLCVEVAAVLAVAYATLRTRDV
ncbi:ABC transporter permease [Micromonospora zhanjiangensis]|uniref:ABC transporter permease n=1 Tax=Micromonospora zhanjiangensis TaxID=1522057 RepID=A0ABV8KEQ3_9ACTN